MMAVLFLASSALIYGGVTKEFTFKAGDVIKAEEVNANFDALFAAVNKAAPAGTVAAFAGSAAPEGWLLCDGSSVSSADYPALFAAIGTSWGGDGSPSFNLPDLRGRFLRGLDVTGTVDPDAAQRKDKNGTVVGAVVGSLQEDEFKSHYHYQGAGSAGTYGRYGSTGGLTAVWHSDIDGEWSPGWQDAALNTSTQGGMETRPKNTAINFIIKI